MVFGFPLSDYDCGIKRFRIESRVRLFSLPLPCSARVACHDRLRDSAIRAAAAPVFRAAVPYCVGAGVPDGPLLVPFMPLAGIFRAPARHPFAHGGKRVQKRRQRPMVFGFPLFPCDHAAKRPTRNCLRVPSPLPLPRPALIVRCSKNSGPTGRTCTCRRWRHVRDLVIAKIGRTTRLHFALQER